MNCVRCGGNFKIEKHHIVHKINGGRDTKDNLVELCQYCHKYQHAKENLLNALIMWFNEMRPINKPKRMKYIKDRVQLTLKRIEVLEAENMPLMILQRGYYAYWNNEETHNPEE